MADKRISELTAATTVNAADAFVLVQSGSTLKVSADVLLSNAPVSVVVKQTAEAPASGALSTTLAYSKVTPSVTNPAYTLAAGPTGLAADAHGLYKTIVCETVASAGTAVVTVTGGKGFATLTFSDVGDAVVLRNVDGFWYIVGNNSVAVA
jgi:hypothetical protein